MIACRYGCGNSVHVKCMKIWAEHQRSTGETIVKCPLCRVDFGSFQVSLNYSVCKDVHDIFLNNSNVLIYM